MMGVGMSEAQAEAIILLLWIKIFCAAGTLLSAACLATAIFGARN